jgi:hypothetical protein
MYLIGLDDESRMRCGTDWQQVSNYKGFMATKKIAMNMIKANHNIKTIYSLNIYPQRLCEMNAEEAGAYVSACGLFIAERNNENLVL